MSGSWYKKLTKGLPRICCDIEPEYHIRLHAIGLHVQVSSTNHNEAVKMLDNAMTWQRPRHIRSLRPFARVWTVDLHTGNTRPGTRQCNAPCHVEFTQETNTSSLHNRKQHYSLPLTFNNIASPGVLAPPWPPCSPTAWCWGWTSRRCCWGHNLRIAPCCHHRL